MPPRKKKATKAKKTAEEEEDRQGPREFKRQKTCPDCGSRNVSFDTENEAMICGDCGVIFEEFVAVEGKEEIELI